MQLALPLSRRGALVAAGARAAEDALCDALAALQEEARRDPRVLARPVRIVVPSRSLRLHLGALLPRRLGRALVGVRIQTLHGLALELLEGERPGARAGGALQEAFALRLARQQAALRPLVEGYADGHRAVAEAVRQLLDAGLVAGLVHAAAEAVEGAEGLEVEERERAIATLQVAAGTERVLDELGLHTPASVMRRAAELLARPGHGRLPARAVFLHGFADATGVAADLLEQLARLPGAVVGVDLPPDPADPARPDAGVRVGARLRERLGVGVHPEAARRAEAPVFAAFGAEGDGEAAEVARRVGALLDAGARPEAIAVVAHDLPARAASLRRWFGRLAIPYSGLDADAPDTPAARWRALPELLRLRERLPMDRWLDLLGAPGELVLDPPLRARVRLALRASGCTRMGQVAELDVDGALGGGDALVLPGALGLDGERLVRPTLAGAELRAIVAAAAAYVAWGVGLPDRARRSAWELHLGTLVTALGRPELAAHWASLAELPDLEMPAEELAILLADALDRHGRTPLGGAGGGVQVLAVREARGRSFDHLFLLGQNRQGSGRRDALLTEAVRLALRQVLPDLPLARDRFDEERLHFAWLCSAAPRVTLSWQTSDAGGKLLTVSPLIERLRWAGCWAEAERAPSPWAAPLPARAAPLDHAVVAARAAPELLRRPLRAALRDRGVAAADTVATALSGALAELDARGAEPGPYQGLVGRALPGDPRERPLYVSVVEAYLACPWRVFLQRLLGVEALPDPLDGIPDADPLLVGNVVHAVLERIVRDALPVAVRTLDRAASEHAAHVPWPEPGALAALVRAEAARLLAEAGVRLPGLPTLVARQVEPSLAVAHAADWADGPPAVLGTEVGGSVEVGGRAVYFRADRVDAVDGGLRLVDYKSGRPSLVQKRERVRREALIRTIRGGRMLQAAAYAASRPDATGRFLYLAPDAEPATRVVEMAHADAEVRDALVHALQVAWAGLDEGVFFARTTEPGDDREPRACTRCEVRDACTRGDSTARARARARGRALADAPADSLGPADRAALALWWLDGTPEPA